ncbi:MAG: branched-chain amino acid ABC transporter permease [Desulfobaccales bacterium]
MVLLTLFPQTMFLQQLINGLTTGSAYALIALGYTMIYGILGLINFAQGEIYMFGAFVAVLLLATGQVPFLVTVAVGLTAAALLGLILERLAFRPHAGRPSPGAPDQRHRGLHFSPEFGPAAFRPQQPSFSRCL